MPPITKPAPATGAPAFYTDANGLQLALCVPGTPNCGPPVPGEAFYYMANSTIALPGGGTASLILNMTVAPNVDNNPAVFNRVRIQIQGAPAGTYTITHPYGTDTVTVATAGARGRTTTDVGCLVATTGVCDFAAALGGRFGPFLTAAPGAFAPVGFIGDAATPVPVVGSPTGSNFFEVDGPGCAPGACVSNTFSLLGKLFAGAVPVFGGSSGAFADQLVDSASATKTITVTNDGIAAPGSNLTISGVALTGANTADYAIASNTCAGATVAAGATCTVGVTFTPGAAGDRTSALTFTDNTAAGTHTVALSGKGTVPAVAPAPVAAPAPAPAPAPVVRPVAPIVATPKLKLDALAVADRLSLRSARRRGVRVKVFAPEGARVVKVRLLRNGHVVTRQVAEVSDDGIATLTLPSTAAGRHALKRGTYTIQVTPGLRPGQYGVTTTRRMRIQ